MKNKKYWLCASYFAFMLIGIPLSILTAIWPNIANSINLNVANLGIVSAVALISNVMALTLASKILTKIGARITTALGIFMQGISFVIMIFAKDLSMCVFSALFFGFGSGLADTSTNYFITVNYEAKNTVWLHAFWSIGSGIGPLLITAILLRGFTYNQAYVLFIPIYFIFAIIIFARLILEKKNDIKTGDIKNKKGPVEFTYKEIFSVKNAFLFFLCMFLADFLQCEVSIWYSSYVVEVYGINDIIAANMLTFLYVGLTASRVIIGFIVEKMGIVKTIIINMIIFIVGSLLLVLRINNIMILYIAISLLGIGVGPVFPLLINFSKKIFREEVLQGVIGLANSSAQIGAFVASTFIGFMVNIFSMQVFTYIVIASGIFALVIFNLLNKRSI